MNLAQVIDYDTMTRSYRINQERAVDRTPQRPTAAPVVVRDHPATPKDDVPDESIARRALRAGGREVLGVLAGAGRFVCFNDLQKRLPHVKERTLQCRLSVMIDRGDVSRLGEKWHYRYGLPSGSTWAST